MPRIKDPVVEEIIPDHPDVYEEQQVVVEIFEPKIIPIKMHNCNHCQIIYKTPKALANHVKNEHDPKNTLLCPYTPDCKNRFSDERKLRIHINRHEAEKSFRDGNYYCRICDKLCATKDLLIAHVGSHNQSYCCDYCGKTFTKHEFMKNHVIQHVFGSQKKEYKKIICELCSQWVQKDRMKRHIYQFHSDKKDFKCEECGKEFKYSNSLRDHLDIHRNNPRFKCEHCGKKFFNYTNWKNHMLRHTDPDRFKCSICDERYSNAKSLANHTLRIHDEKKEKLQCPNSNCEKFYFVDAALKNHIRRVHVKEKKTLIVF